MNPSDTSPTSTIVGKVTNAALVLLALALLGATVAVFSGAYQVRPVLSSSMTPQLPVGSVVITQRVPVTQVRAHDVIVFHDPYDPDKLVVHRVMTIKRESGTTTITTKGDANAVGDPWTVNLRGNDSYRVVGNVPVVGRAAVWIHQPAIQANLLPIGAGLGLLSLAILFWPRRKPVGDDNVEPRDAEIEAVGVAGLFSGPIAPAPRGGEQFDAGPAPWSAASEATRHEDTALRQ
jgi:signal peptidase I